MMGELEKNTFDFADWVCKTVCYKPKVIVDHNELTEHCSKCEIGKHIIRIINRKEQHGTCVHKSD